VPSSGPFLQADYLGIHHQSYLLKYDCISRLAPGGVLVINSEWESAEEMAANLPPKVLRHLAALKVRARLHPSNSGNFDQLQ
jgi:Pyruvate/2-oxoacid:ferredoxin oxidoreductase gamma subunit